MTYMDGLEFKTTLTKKIEQLFDVAGFTHVWENQNTFSVKRLEKALVDKFKERYIKYWKDSLDEDSNEYNKKLKVYSKLKLNYELENYLLLGIDKKDITTFVKLRISDSRLMIEQGRHKQLPVENRLCPLCKLEVEDEYHFITQCRNLNNPRTNLFDKITDVIPDFIHYNNVEKFKFLLAPKEMDISKICVTEINNMYELRSSVSN